MSQVTLAKLAGVDRSTISEAETSVRVPKAPTLRLIADALATDGDGVRDPVRADESYRRLMVAAGYMPTSEPSTPPPADTGSVLREVTAKLGPDDAEIIDEVVEVLADWPRDERRRALEITRTLIMHWPRVQARSRAGA
jgi:transcriptional regulator with XRE-family HTH domain